MANEVALVVPFSVDPTTGSVVTTTDQSVIWSNRVRSAIETLIGERVMRPSYGTKIPNAILSTITGVEDVLQKEISRVFVEQLPLLTLGSINATHEPKENVLTVDVTFTLPNRVETTIQAGVMTLSADSPFYEEKS